jgi:hypothetical protein
VNDKESKAKKWLVPLFALAGVLLVACLTLLSRASQSRDSVEAYKDRLRAAGEELDPRKLAPPLPDPDKNGGPILFRAAVYLEPPQPDALTTNPPDAMRPLLPGVAIAASRQPEIKRYDCTNSWAEMEDAVEARVRALDLLREAADLPVLNFTLDYSEGFDMRLIHLTVFKRSAQLLSAATLVDLRRGETSSAVTNLNELLTLARHWNEEPLLLSQLVRAAAVQTAFAAQWEALEATPLTDEELSGLEQHWRALDFVRPFERSLQMDRAMMIVTIQQWRGSNSPSTLFFGSSGSSGATVADWFKDLGETAKRRTADELWRASWSYTDELNVLRADQVVIDGVRQIRTNGFFGDALAQIERGMRALGLDKAGDNWLRRRLGDNLRMMVGSVDSQTYFLGKFLQVETARTLAVAAIALKRYELRHGQLPGDLNALVPEFLGSVPRDPVDGRPLRYQLNSDGTFLLYSIGADGVDNGGDASPVPPSRICRWNNGRDWVWPRAATPAEISAYEASRSTP